jgi:hypothetical protein
MFAVRDKKHSLYFRTLVLYIIAITSVATNFYRAVDTNAGRIAHHAIISWR